jgi:cathepsin L
VALCTVQISAANLQLDSAWNGFLATFKKAYKSESEALKRRIIWEENLALIQAHNLEHDLGLHTFTMGMNEHADLTKSEFQEKFLGLKVDARKFNATKTYKPKLNAAALPTEVDWVKSGYVTPVKNQKSCGSCWAFSTTGSLEGQYYRKNKKLVSFSEQQLVDCSRSYGNNGCSGGLMDNAFKYIKDQGIESEADYPYTAVNNNCKYSASKVVTKVSGFTDVQHGNEAALQSALSTVGPVSVAIDASHSSFQFYKAGVYNEQRCSSTSLDHGVLAVGFGNENGNDFWLVKNSWGTSWGVNGFIKMSRNSKNQCGIASMASYPVL